MLIPASSVYPRSILETPYHKAHQQPFFKYIKTSNTPTVTASAAAISSHASHAQRTKTRLWDARPPLRPSAEAVRDALGPSGAIADALRAKQREFSALGTTRGLAGRRHRQEQHQHQHHHHQQHTTQPQQQSPPTFPRPDTGAATATSGETTGLPSRDSGGVLGALRHGFGSWRSRAQTRTLSSASNSASNHSLSSRCGRFAFRICTPTRNDVGCLNILFKVSSLSPF